MATSRLGTYRLWAYEARRCGPAALALPILTCVVVLVCAAAARSATTADPHTVAAGMVRLVSLLIPVAAGIATTAALGRERLTELQLSLPIDYRTTVRRRLVVVTGVVTVAAAVAVGVLIAFDQWEHPARGPLALLIPLGPSLLLVGVGTWADVALRSTAGASAVVVGAWLLEVTMFDRVMGSWQANRVLLILAGAVFVGLAMRGLRDTERLIRKEGE